MVTGDSPGGPHVCAPAAPPARRPVRRRAGSAAVLAAAALAGPSRQPRHAAPLHRLRLRPVRDAVPVDHGRLAAQLAVLGGGHLHLRGLPRLPHAAQPDPAVGLDPAAQRLAAAADHVGAAGLLQPELPALPRRRTRQPELDEQLRRGPQPGTRRGRGRRRGGPAVGHHHRLDALVRHGGLRHRQHPLPRVGAALHLGVDAQAAQARLRLGRLLQRRVRHEGHRRRARQPARRLHRARPDLDRPVGRPGRHLHVVPPPRRLVAAAAG